MNHIYRSIWNDKTGTFAAVSETAKAAGKETAGGTSTGGHAVVLYLKATSVAVMLAFGANALAQPVGGAVVNGGATIQNSAGNTTINQSTQNAVINWQSFSIEAGQVVQFVQPNTSSVTLNRVVGGDPSSILGTLSANGKVFLVNPNGILFAKGASVNVGGLVASTLNITDSDFMTGNYRFSGNGSGTVKNEGSISANGGYVAMLGANVSNQGVIAANLGTVVLAAGEAITLDVAGDGLLNVTVNKGAIDALIENGGLIRADGGKVLLTASAAGDLLKTVVNNTGVIEAQTLDNRSGTIMLLADMQSGTVNVGGKLDASAPNGGDGGFVETSAAHVNILSGAGVTTAAPAGSTGTWLIDPQDFVIGNGPGANMSSAGLSAQLVTTSVTITTSAIGTGMGDIYVNDFVEWTATPLHTTLTLNALNDININAYMTATNGSFVLNAARDVNMNAAVTANSGNISVCCGRDINVNSAITTTSGSILLGAGRDLYVNQFLTGGAIKATDGNISMCAAEDIYVNGAITVTNGTEIPALSLGLPLGLTVSAGYGAGAPGIGGTLVIAAASPKVTVTKAPALINYNPVSYSTPTDYSTNFTLTEGATLTQKMYVFASVSDKTFDGTTTATLTGLKGSPLGVSLLPSGTSTAIFETAAVGANKVVNYTGYTLAGTDANKYTLAVPCCGPAVAKTTGNIIAAVTPPVDQPLREPLPETLPEAQETLRKTLPEVLTPLTPFPSSYMPPVIPLTVVSAELPTVAVVEETPVAPVEEVSPVAPPVEEVPPAEVPYVAPKRAPKQDRG
ncbi:MAG: filamentous hemagglutinin N-terminal domain-containing protein [Thiobacillus sp.]|nr:filamentous hemagglutinin N-terminal domain-containing protein [Thiobacillus sp.]